MNGGSNPTRIVSDDDEDERGSKPGTKVKEKAGSKRKASKKGKKKTKDKKEGKKRSRSTEAGDDADRGSDHKRSKKDKSKTKAGKKERKREKKARKDKKGRADGDGAAAPSFSLLPSSHFPFDIRYVVAPMVGASELAFRLLARKYGATLAYTPMMSAAEFARSESYRKAEFQTVQEDRPLVCHFSSNNPDDFAAAARLVEPVCDAVDLNLGCPQRTAYVGHFGSYLLDRKDRDLVLDIVRTGAAAVNIPIFVKIRLLDNIGDTVELCRQLRGAGAALIAIHGRYRATFKRDGPGARDGPAMLDQIAEVRRALGPGFPLLANGNVITYDDVLKNAEETSAEGVMSAEGLLDNPALFLGKYRGKGDDFSVNVAVPSALPGVTPPSKEVSKDSGPLSETAKKMRKLAKKLREIERIEKKMKDNRYDSINSSQREKLASRSIVEKAIAQLKTDVQTDTIKDEVCAENYDITTDIGAFTSQPIRLGDLLETANDRLRLAMEYLALARRYPVKIRSVIFHTRRMCKVLLSEFQMMEECIGCKSIDEVGSILSKLETYRADPASFVFDKEKAIRDKEALEKKRREEGKRKAYEARMARKAKREGLADLEFYLRQGAEVPTVETVNRLKNLPRDAQLREWKTGEHSQHCLAYHLDPKGCKRDRACAFLHVEAKGSNSFVEQDEVAG